MVAEMVHLNLRVLGSRKRFDCNADGADVLLMNRIDSSLGDCIGIVTADGLEFLGDDVKAEDLDLGRF